jgi:salicylate hydroxylase
MSEPKKRGLDVARREPQIRLRFTVIGGSLAGLATAYGLTLIGHQVCVVEQSNGTVQSSNGVTCPPNMTKILKDWGLQSWLDQVGTRCKDMHFLDSLTGERIGTLDFDQKYSGKIDADFYFLIYDDLYYKLRGLAEDEGVEFLFSTRVTAIDTDAVEVTLDNGRRLSADVIIGADGTSSVTSSVVNDSTFEMNEDHGEEFLAAGYTIPTTLLAQDPELLSMVKPGALNYWLGDLYLIAGTFAGPDNFYLTIYTPMEMSRPDIPIEQDWRRIQKCTLEKLNLPKVEQETTSR